MATLSPNDIGLLVAKFMAGYFPAGGIWVVNSQGVKIPPDPQAKAGVIKFLDTAIAVCLAESGGNTKAKNAGSSASGLWQILATTHADRIKSAIKYIETEYRTEGLDVFDPRVNTTVAQELYGAAKGWTPWEVYNKGTYKKELGHGAKVYEWLNSQANIDKVWHDFVLNQIENQGTVDIAQLPGSIGGALNPSNWANWVEPVLRFLKDAGVSVGVFLLGVVILLIGAAILASQNKTAQSVVKAVK